METQEIRVQIFYAWESSERGEDRLGVRHQVHLESKGRAVGVNKFQSLENGSGLGNEAGRNGGGRKREIDVGVTAAVGNNHACTIWAKEIPYVASPDHDVNAGNVGE